MVPRRPDGLLYADWLAFGRRCKRLAVHYRRGLAELRYRMAHPSPLVSYTQWRPLVRWHWPAGLVEVALQVIRLESGGRPWAQNPSSGAGGLFQLCPPPAGWADPDFNVRYAYQVKYRSQGWRAWVVMW